MVDSNRSAASPLGVALLQKRTKPLVRVLSSHQLIEIQPLDHVELRREVFASGQLERTLGEPKRGSAVPCDSTQPLLGLTFELTIGEYSVDQAQLKGGLGIDRVAREKHFQAPSWCDLPGQLVGGDGRKHTQRDFRLAESRFLGDQDEVAGQRELAPSAQCRTSYQSDTHQLQPIQDPEAFVENSKHRLDFVAHVILHAGTGGKGLLSGRCNDQQRTVGAHFRETLTQLLEHGNVEDVERRIIQRDAIRGVGLVEKNLRHDDGSYRAQSVVRSDRPRMRCERLAQSRAA